MEKKTRIGIYLTPKVIVNNPDYLQRLHDELGLNLLVLIYTGELPDSVLAHSPFDAIPPSPERVTELLAWHYANRPATQKLDVALKSVGPHVDAGGDDKEVRAAIEIARKVGLEIWFMGGAWTSMDRDVLMYCPSHEANNHWYETVFTHLATAYDVDGLDITHARFPMVSYPRGLLLCFAPSSAQLAAELGYDMDQMRADIGDAYSRLRALSGRRIVDIFKHASGPFDYMQLLGMRQGVVDFFKFRSEMLGNNLIRFRNAVHAAAGDDFIFGADTYPASFSLLAGHNHQRWGEYSDFASPLLSHVDIFPMRTMVESANFLTGLYSDISEAEALQVVYRFAGYDSLAMPSSIADFALGEPDCEFRHMPLVDLVTLDMAKARLYLPEDLPSYPIIQGGGAPHDWPREATEALMRNALALGHDGYIFQGTRMLVDYSLR
jgi:hypothetical protein